MVLALVLCLLLLRLCCGAVLVWWSMVLKLTMLPLQLLPDRDSAPCGSDMVLAVPLSVSCTLGNLKQNIWGTHKMR
jgi:hypothetical protein